MIDGKIYGNYTQLHGGHAGYGATNTNSATSSIALAQVGPRSHAVPATIDRATIQTSSFPDKVDFRWTETPDPSSVGYAQHNIYRDDGAGGTVNFYAQGFLNPTFSDAAVLPSRTYNYAILDISFHGIQGSGALFQVVTPGPGSVDPRRIGTRPTGAYWGATGENIDMLSGNVNFSIPLIKTVGRLGTTATFTLSYNSQLWRKDSGGDWLLGEDTGYGIGWSLMAGSLTPYWNGGWYGAIDHYTFTDASGAEYRLYDPSHTGIFTACPSTIATALCDPTYVTFDANQNRLYFNDGSFWVMGATSAGTQYPTVMQDTNGNQIVITYNAGRGTSWLNSSSRIDTIQDARATSNFNCYTFIYDATADAVPHLTRINVNSALNTGESYDFGYTRSLPLYSAVTNTAPFQQTDILMAVSTAGFNSPYNFTYGIAGNGTTGELAKIRLPAGGTIEYGFINTTYNSNRILRNIDTRYLTASLINPVRTQYQLTSSTGSRTITDPTGNQRTYTFSTDTSAANVWSLGLLTGIAYKTSTGTALKQEQYTWLQQTVSHQPYIGVLKTILDNGTTARVENIQDQYGNAVQKKVYDYADATTPLRTYSYAHLTDSNQPNASNYAAAYVRDRVTVATVSTGNTTTTTQQNWYDGSGTNCAYLLNAGGTPAAPDTAAARLHDPAVTSTTFRGNRTQNTGMSGTSCWAYDNLGNVYYTINPSGPPVKVTNTSFLSPNQISAVNGTSSLTTTFSFTDAAQLSGISDPAGVSASMTYDVGLPVRSLSPTGLPTLYFYYPHYYNPNYFPSTSGWSGGYSYTANSPSAQISFTGARWVRNTSDGLGRTIRTETGKYQSDGVTLNQVPISVVDTEYGPCACSPVGKMVRVSQPYKPGDPVYWNTYTYDALGRTIAMTPPDSASTSTTTYSGNSTTSTDASSKWKTTTTNVQGNVTMVLEPGGLTTTYTYDMLEHLTGVSMPRATATGSYTQTRTFHYNAAGQLDSETQPETGTTTYTYYPGQDKLYTKIDAKNQKTEFTYDGFGRAQIIKHYLANGTEDPCQRTEYIYSGSRLAATRTGDLSTGCTSNHYLSEEYQYGAAGLISAKTLHLTRPSGPQLPDTPPPALKTVDFTATFEYNPEGSLTRLVYPDGTAIANTYDEWNRQITGHGVTTKTYNAANQLLSLNGNPITYNSMNQITGMNGMSFDYYPNGQIKSEVTGSAATIYTYDSLKRLSTATNYLNGTAQRAQAYTYDGWGNLTNKTPTLGTAQSLTLNIDPATNRVLQTPACYDANGNMIGAPPSCSPSLTYDVSNRIATVTGGPTYSYDAKNKRISALHADGTEELFFYGPNGRKLSTIQVSAYGVMGTTKNLYYFAGKIVGNSAGAVTQDSLGSIGAYDPWGEDLAPNPVNDTEKFATYTRDSVTGLDYADQRYYTSQFGRFMSADPYSASGRVNKPGTWNRYSYVSGDPINLYDSHGLMPEQRGSEPVGTENDWCFFNPWSPTCDGIGGGGSSPSGHGDDDQGNGARGGGQTNAASAALLARLGAVIAGLGSNCRGVLGSKGLTTTGLTANANHLTLYDVTGTDGQKTLGQVSSFYYGTNSQLLSAYASDFQAKAAGAVAITLSVKDSGISAAGTIYLPVVVLTRAFFDASETQQNFVLLHELLHYQLQASDEEILESFKILPIASGDPLTTWLMKDCKN